MRPPGREIYRMDDVSVFEMCGTTQKIACQCLSLLGKLFVDDHPIFYNVESWVFYVLYECGDGEPHVVAFFSRSLVAESDLIASLVVFPPFQRRRYGQLLISLAYELARRAGLVGGPMEPINEESYITFRCFWRATILDLLRTSDVQTVDEIAAETAICHEDVVVTLAEFRCLVRVDGCWAIDRDAELLVRSLAESATWPRRRKIDTRMLMWLPGDGPQLLAV
jgi:histone acetyltransferase MYST1